MSQEPALFGDRQADRRRMIKASVVGTLLYGLLVGAVWQSPAAPERHAEARLSVRTFDKKVNLKKPKPPPPPLPKEPPPPPPTPPPEPVPQPVEVTSATPKPVKKPRRRRRRARKRKGTKAPVGPKTVVLKNTALEGSVAVYGGDEDVLGNPEVAATPETTKPADGPDDNGAVEGDAVEPVPTAAAAKPKKVVAPKVIERLQGRFPANAPRDGRAVRITLSLRINKKGRVVRARVVYKPTFVGAAFTREAKRVAKATRFKAATRGGKPIDFTIRYVVEFRR